MPPKTLRKRKSGTDVDSFLRSINICYDAAEPDRIAHFRPTSKCATLLRALLGDEDDRAFLIAAPYGTGKSLTVTYLLHLVENRPDSSSILLEIGKKLSDVSPELGRYAASRRRKRNSQGIAIAMHGPCESLPRSLKSALLDSMARLKLGHAARTIRAMPSDTIEDAIAILNELKKRCLAPNCDQIVIIWDEFGRHVEALANEGRGDVLNEVQLLAEFASRSRKIPITLGLLMHQGLLHYAGNLPQSVRADWKKIEGRFQAIEYIDDSKEIYRLIAEVVTDRFPTRPLSRAKVANVARKCRDQGLFSEFTRKELGELLYAAQPLNPVVLYLLPRVSARVAQNERTLFSFLHSADLSQSVDAAALFDYFAPAMRSDTAVGGTHRQWLETQSAVTKVPEDDDAGKTLKTACLLGFGTSGERTRTGRELLLLALNGFGESPHWKKVLSNLVSRNLLLHRRHNDEVSVWHGTDLDLRGRLEEERHRVANDFDLVSFLAKEAKPPAWKPVEYNDDFGVRRYLKGQYQDVDQLISYVHLDASQKAMPLDCDGEVIYVVASNTEELHRAEKFTCESLSHDRLMIAIPREPLPIREAALEVACLTRIQDDNQFIESDPLALAEVQQMTDDARSHLEKLVDKLTKPSPVGPRWFCHTGEVLSDSPRDLRHELSKMMRRVFSKTPRIHNEMIVRKKPSAIVVNARKKLLLGILERHGQEELGIHGNFPDKSMFRTVLVRTGLYKEDRTGRWNYVSPHAIKDSGLKAVWREIQKFLTVPSETPKEVSGFLSKMIAPPFGVRAGLLPIFFAAGLKAFPSSISLMRSGEYVDDILPSEIEQLCRTPERYSLAVLDLDDEKATYLRKLHKKFTPVKGYEVAENDLIRLCYDAIESWKSQLPPAAMSTRRLSERAMAFRTALSRGNDPLSLLFETLPAACDASIEKTQPLLRRLGECMAELTGVATIYADRAAASVRSGIALGADPENDSIRAACESWASCFSDSLVETLSDRMAKGLLARMQIEYDSDELLLDSLSSLLVGRSLSRWDDVTVGTFDREFQNIVRRVEDIALSSEGIQSDAGRSDHGISQLVRGRMAELFERLAKLVGVEKATAVLESVPGDLESVACGNN